MEQSNKIQRSEVWEQIYKVVSKIPRKEVDSDAADAPSVATELEKLFLKLLPIHDVIKSVCENCSNIDFNETMGCKNYLQCFKCENFKQTVL